MIKDANHLYNNTINRNIIQKKLFDCVLRSDILLISLYIIKEKEFIKKLREFQQPK